MVSNEDACGGRQDGDQGPLEHPVQVAGGDVDEDVAPGEGQGHDGVEQAQDQDDHCVVLVLRRHQHPADVIAEEVACREKQ